MEVVCYAVKANRHTCKAQAQKGHTGMRHIPGFAIIIGSMLHHGSSLRRWPQSLEPKGLSTGKWLSRRASPLQGGQVPEPGQVQLPPGCGTTSYFWGQGAAKCSSSMFRPTQGAGVLFHQGWHGTLRKHFENSRTFLDHIHLTNGYHLLTMGQIGSRHWGHGRVRSWSFPSCVT